MMDGVKEHWNAIFKTTSHEKLGWFECDFGQTLKYLSIVGDMSAKTVFIAGAGTSMLVDKLIGKCRKLYLNDISDESLSIVRERIKKAEQDIEWVHTDIAEPLPINDAQIHVWIDRAVLHFLTEEHQINGYFKNLDRLVTVGGTVLLAQFSKAGAPKCAGLELHRYSVEELTERCGPSFALLQHENYTFINPNGDNRPYVYCLFKKVK